MNNIYISDDDLKDFLISLKETLILLGSYEKDGQSGVQLTHCAKHHLAKITSSRIDVMLANYKDFKKSNEF